MITAICVGGPMHGAFVTQPTNAFSVARPPGRPQLIKPETDQTKYADYQTGNYWLHFFDVPGEDHTSYWKWHGWSA